MYFFIPEGLLMKYYLFFVLGIISVILGIIGFINGIKEMKFNKNRNLAIFGMLINSVTGIVLPIGYIIIIVLIIIGGAH